jgi:hypothetical protein
MIESRLPAALPQPFYARWRDLILVLSVAVCLLLATSGILYPQYRL